MDPDSTDSGADSAPPLRSGADEQELSQFIENMGLHYENYGVPRIGGRILGLLILTPRPISSEEMSEALQVSRSSISTNLRTLMLNELVEKVSLPGERVDYYTLTEDVWQKSLELQLSNVFPLRDLAEEGLESLDEGHPARERMEEIISWINRVEDAFARLNQDWQSGREASAEG